MSDPSDSIYKDRSYGAGEIGYGDMPGIAVVDFRMPLPIRNMPWAGHR